MQALCTSVGSARLLHAQVLPHPNLARPCSSRVSVRARSQSEGTRESTSRKTPDAKSTIAGIDALLGIEEEKPQEKSNVEISVSAAALNTLSNADGMSAATLDSLMRIIGTAKELDSSSAARNVVDGAMREEVERVTRSLNLNSSVSQHDVTIIKEEILGPKSFWVTEVAFLENELAGGVLLRGNLRAGEPSEAFSMLVDGCAKRFGNQYTVNMVFDTQFDDMPRDNAPRVAFQILPTPIATPNMTAGWATFAAIILLLLTLGSTMSLGVLAALPKLPAETLAWLSTSDNPDFNGVVPGITATYDPIPFISVVTTMFLSITGVNFAHETGHRLVAALKKVKLGPALFVPNGSLGSFGSVTMQQSLIRDRSTMWDVAAAGPIAGLAAGGALFVYGLLASTDPNVDPAMLIPVPSFLFQGSIALGAVAEAVLGNGVDGKVQVHPAVIAGWCTLFTQAFNLLPVGSLDGGRLTQSAYGRSALDWAGVLSYMGLALGVIGSSLSLPFGLFVLLAQRQPERYLQDQVTGVGRVRETITTVLILLAILILIPFTPDSPDMMDMLPSVLPTSTTSLTI